MSKIVFLDVDGTLIDYEAKLPASAAKAVDQARANGHKVYICTGCSKAEILQRNLCDLDGMIGGNGAYVEDNNHVVMHQGLSKEDVKNIVDWCNERHIGFYLEANSGMYCNDYMLEQGPETMVKYAKGKGASLENAKSSAQHFINGFIHLQGDELYRDDVNKISFILRWFCNFINVSYNANPAIAITPITIGNEIIVALSMNLFIFSGSLNLTLVSKISFF